ncbi:hypothetical protein Barb4_02890 [Bacteroidales bacterium Barb4]|nr:hypothetical protein Barb4_02890 [Bacteroidales bacterium Barb4]
MGLIYIRISYSFINYKRKMRTKKILCLIGCLFIISSSLYGRSKEVGKIFESNKYPGDAYAYTGTDSTGGQWGRYSDDIRNKNNDRSVDNTSEGLWWGIRGATKNPPRAGDGEWNYGEEYETDFYGTIWGFASDKIFNDINTGDYKKGKKNAEAWKGFVNRAGRVDYTVWTVITSIADHAFDDHPSVTKLYLHPRISKIGASAFEGQRALKSIKVKIVDEKEEPDYGSSNSKYDLDADKYKLDEIGNRAFRGTTGLRSFDISGVTLIGDSAFEGSGLESYTARKTVTINKDAFRASHLESIDLNDGADLKDGCFADCRRLSSVTLSPEIHTLPDYCFAGTNELKSIDISYIETLGAFAFGATDGGISSGLDSIGFGNDLTTIPDNAFSGCASLRTITFNKVSKIGPRAFEGTALKTLDLPEGVTHIAEGAFQDCTDLEDIIIPYTVSTIGNLAFQRCTNLKTVTIKNPALETGAAKNAFSGCPSTVKISYPTTGQSKETAALWAGVYEIGGLIVSHPEQENMAMSVFNPANVDQSERHVLPVNVDQSGKQDGDFNAIGGFFEQKPYQAPAAFSYDNLAGELKFENMQNYNVTVMNASTGRVMSSAMGITESLQRTAVSYAPGCYVMRAKHKTSVDTPPLSITFLVR